MPFVRVTRSSQGTLEVSWLREYHDKLLANIYSSSLYGGASKLEMLWLFYLGGAVFAAIDLSLNLTEPLRWILLGVFLAPGVLWFLYVLFHELRSVRGRIRHHKDELKRERQE